MISRLSHWTFIACGLWLIALGVYFIALRPALLPEDLRYMGTTLAQARVALPGLEGWLAQVFTVLGGFIAGTGVLTVFIALAPAPRRTGTLLALALSGLSTVGLMSASNFALHSDFRWLLLVPAVLWFAGLLVLGLPTPTPPDPQPEQLETPSPS